MAEQTSISLEQFNEFCRRLSGKNKLGDSNGVVAYQAYAIEDEEDSIDKQTIYNITMATVDLVCAKSVPGFVQFDIIFNAYDDTELKLLWGRLQRQKKNESLHPEKTYIFHFHIMERASVSNTAEVNDTLFSANIINPYLSFLTRENPTTMVVETVSNGELCGGNVVRMLVPVELVTFESNSSLNTSELKGEVLRDIEAAEYVDNYEPPVDDGEIWD